MKAIAPKQGKTHKVSHSLRVAPLPYLPTAGGWSVEQLWEPWWRWQREWMQAWQLMAWTPWNLTLSAWQLADTQSQTAEPPTGLLSAVLAGEVAKFHE